jgi:hypothetical protein
MNNRDALFVVTTLLIAFADGGKTHTAKAQTGDHGAVFAKLLVLHSQNLTYWLMMQPLYHDFLKKDTQNRRNMIE